MIKVIKHGKMRQCTCYKCQCVFTFEKEDVKYVITGINESCYVVECPDCGERNEVSV